jgi:hypothetical protein
MKPTVAYSVMIRPRSLLCRVLEPSNTVLFSMTSMPAGMTELADVSDLKSEAPKGAWGFDSPSRHHTLKDKDVTVRYPVLP